MVAGIPPLRSGRCAAASVGMTACDSDKAVDAQRFARDADTLSGPPQKAVPTKEGMFG